MAIRVAESMRVKPASGRANPSNHIVNSEGDLDANAWGRRAKWCAYSGIVNSQIVTIAIFDHPENPRFPTWWMARDYGLLTANPFGRHAFEPESAPHAGDLRIKAGASTTFRYRFLFCSGAADQANLSRQFEDFSAAR
jgi:hypothetical protein